MKRLTLYAAITVAALTGTSSITSQAAVKTYVISGNSGCGNTSGSKNYFGNNYGNTGNGTTGNHFSGNNCSINDVLQMITSGNSDSNCQNNRNYSFSPTLPGTLDNPLIPNCPGNSNSQTLPDFSGSSGCPSTNISGNLDSSGCVDILKPNLPSSGVQKPDTQNPDIQKPDSQKPDIQKPDTQNPDTQNPDTQNPSTQNPGTQNPDIQNPGTQNPDIQNPDTQNPDTQNPGTQNPDIQNPDIQNPDTQNPGTQNPGTQNPGTQNPDIQNPDTQNPDIQNPGTHNPSLPSTSPDRSYAQQVIDLVNEERSKAGLSPVTESSDISAAAAIRAQEITINFSHNRPDGSYYNTVLDQSGISYWGSGENIAYGQRTPAEVMNGWMNSQGHRANILNGSYTKIGVAYYQNSNGVTYWVQLFTY